MSQADATEHSLMVMDQLTKKTHVVRHLSGFVQPGAVRVENLADAGALRIVEEAHEATLPARSIVTLQGEW